MNALPDLGNVAQLAALVMAIIAGLKLAWPRLAGGGTVALAAAFSFALSALHAAAQPGPLTAARLETATLTALCAWLASITGAWAVRFPLKRSQIWSDQ